MQNKFVTWISLLPQISLLKILNSYSLHYTNIEYKILNRAKSPILNSEEDKLLKLV